MGILLRKFESMARPPRRESPEAMSDAKPTLPFSGYTVLDVSGSVATATAGKLFADFGARVVNVEPPGGHPTRLLPPHRPGSSGPESSGLHALLSPNKESVVFDLDERDGLLDLVAAADVVLESEPVGALAAKGLDFDTLASLAPELMTLRAPDGLHEPELTARGDGADSCPVAEPLRGRPKV
jgi:crotonobetainyl-CoA:carnitine CoA-transferase CaiB-like acyl-CoA transferase